MVAIGTQLQDVAYNLPGAIEEYDEQQKNDVFGVLVKKLNDHFSPEQNSTFERHVFRTIKTEGGETFNKFLLRVRQQSAKCSFGTSKNEAIDINLKDKLIDSWASAELKKKLLEKERSLDEVIELCRVHEEISTQSTVMNQVNSEPGPSYGHINKVEIKGRQSNECARCGRTDHKTQDVGCPARKVKCHRWNTKRWRNAVNRVDEDDHLSQEREEDREVEIERFDCFKVGNGRVVDNSAGKDGLIEYIVGGVKITMLIDSGSKVNVINGTDWKTLTRNKTVVWELSLNSEKTLKPYASGTLRVDHKFRSTITVGTRQEIIADFFVIEGGDVSLVGKDTYRSSTGNTEDGFGRKCISGKHVVSENQERVPITVEEAVERKLDETLRKGIIEKVREPSEWVSPIVVIFKPGGDIRICIDVRRVELDEESRPITTFITHKGMFRYTRLLFGVKSAPEIFQRIIEAILAECEGCLNYIDDIIVYGGTEEEHDINLSKVLKTLKENNAVLNDNKCLFKVQNLEFLGHKLSVNGIEAADSKVKTILEFRSPNTKGEVRSFLGLVTYMGKFIPDLGSITDSLRQLIKQDVKFIWTSTHQKAFDKLKRMLAKPPALGYFDPKRRTRLVADASPVALGAVLIQFDDQEVPKIISFASKSLSIVERKYSQTEKESLALVWAVERFYFYLAGLYFELETDHKPLEVIFKPSSKPAARIERWVLRLQAFKFKIIYRPGKQNIADCVSRLCPSYSKEPIDIGSEYHIYTVIEAATPKAVTISQIFNESKNDEHLKDAINKIENEAWESADASPYYPFRFELTNSGPILLRGNRIIIPNTLRQQILKLAHEGHPGKTAMKRRLRAKVWWPQIDREAEKMDLEDGSTNTEVSTSLEPSEIPTVVNALRLERKGGMWRPAVDADRNEKEE
ncbi:uncharacterized protein LOC116163872 [Photinus pyralis]|uniref:uncharacterized protein LOC116163872 n=1 Tax=Photinus pyralis TaxID=7054 RepID=UPI00126701F0|nr:uncharacterized protein LOC116163872 [Photinus pyralis]